jgi:hypothetical protein
VEALVASSDLKGNPMTNRKSTRAAPKPKNKASKADQLKSLLAKPDGMTAEGWCQTNSNQSPFFADH